MRLNVFSVSRFDRWDESAGRLIFPGSNSLIPGVLNETILAMNLISKNRMPGHDYKFLLRTNLSSFWRFDLLLKYLEKLAGTKKNFPLYCGHFWQNNNDPPFVTGKKFLALC